MGVTLIGSKNKNKHVDNKDKRKLFHLSEDLFEIFQSLHQQRWKISEFFCGITCLLTSLTDVPPVNLIINLWVEGLNSKSLR